MKIEIEPIFADSFDFRLNRGNYQVRINIWGWLAKIIYLLMFKNWRKRGFSPQKEGLKKAIDFHASISKYVYNEKGYLTGYESKDNKQICIL